jgi:transcriptional regulator with XRE-family HTH domain
MGTRKRTLTAADKRALAKVRELWAEFQKKNPGITQEAAAERAGMGQSAFSQFLLGTVPMRVTPVLKFAKLFDVDPRTIRDDLVELAAYTPATPSKALEVREPDISDVSEEALEIARAFDKMQPQTKERVREHVFMYSVIDKSFPWLRTGRPVSDNYGKFEKWHVDNMQAQLALEAARIAKRAKGHK